MKLNKVGVVKNSFNDSPNGTARVIFFPFCNMKCRYCYNSSLAKGIEPKNGVDYSFEYENKNSLFYFLKDNLKISNNGPFLGDDWIIFSGGEPTLFPNEIQEIMTMEEVIKYDHFMMDVHPNFKNSFGDYNFFKNAWKPKYGIFTNANNLSFTKNFFSIVKTPIDWVSIDLKLEGLDYFNNFKDTVDIWCNKIHDIQLQTVIYKSALSKFDLIYDFVLSLKNNRNYFNWNINQLLNMNGEVEFYDKDFDFKDEVIFENEIIDKLKNQVLKLKDKMKNLTINFYGEKLF